MAQAVYDENEANAHLKQDYLQSQLQTAIIWLIAMLIVSAVAVLAGLSELPVDASDPAALADPVVLVAAIFLGMLGASLTVIQSLLEQSKTTSVPEVQHGRSRGWARPLIGGASGLLAYLVFGAGVIHIIVWSAAHPTLPG